VCLLHARARLLDCIWSRRRLRQRLQQPDELRQRERLLDRCGCVDDRRADVHALEPEHEVERLKVNVRKADGAVVGKVDVEGLRELDGLP
jgi:hypothetical protein